MIHSPARTTGRSRRVDGPVRPRSLRMELVRRQSVYEGVIALPRRLTHWLKRGPSGRSQVMPKKPSMKESAYAFRHALTCDRSEAAKLLRKYPQLIDYPVYGDSESALHFFAVENQVDIVKWLLAHGASPKGIEDGDSPLHSAAQLGHEDVCRELLEAGSDPNQLDFLGETALHKASARGCITVIELLLASGADPAITEMCGELPVDQALPRKRDEVCAVFDRHAATEQPKPKKRRESNG